MRKTTAIIFAVLLLLTVFVSCNHEEIVDEAFTFTITFRGNDPAFDETAIQKIGKGIPIELRDNALKREGYVLVGWNSETDGSGTSYTNGQRVSFDGDITLYAKWAIALTSETTTLTDGNAYSFDRDILFAERIAVSGNVTLILPDGYNLTAQKGISVNNGNSLTIQAIGTGELAATIDDNDLYNSKCAGIGGDKDSSSGIITINGGIIRVTSGMYGAAIGGGYDCAGTVIINGGTVTATSGMYGAAIGGGDFGNGAVTVNGGTVIATSGDFGAGIGGGFGGNGTVTINGGTVTATGNTGAGVGVGYTGSGGSVTINGGTVVSTSLEDGAGIGGTYIGSGIDVTINGGQIHTQGANGAAGIGRGRLGTGDGTLTLGEGVALQVSDDNSNWADYDGTTRTRYMRTK